MPMLRICEQSQDAPNTSRAHSMLQGSSHASFQSIRPSSEVGERSANEGSRETSKLCPRPSLRLRKAEINSKSLENIADTESSCYRHRHGFHSFLYHGFIPMAWWGLFFGMFPMSLKYPCLTKRQEPDVEKAGEGIFASKMTFRYVSWNFIYCLVLIGFSAYLSVRTVVLLVDPAGDCYENFDDNLTTTAPMTKFDQAVLASTVRNVGKSYFENHLGP